MKKSKKYNISHCDMRRLREGVTSLNLALESANRDARQLHDEIYRIFDTAEVTEMNRIIDTENVEQNCDTCPLSKGAYQGCELSVPHIATQWKSCIDIRIEAKRLQDEIEKIIDTE